MIHQYVCQVSEHEITQYIGDKHYHLLDWAAVRNSALLDRIRGLHLVRDIIEQRDQNNHPDRYKSYKRCFSDWPVSRIMLCFSRIVQPLSGTY